METIRHKAMEIVTLTRVEGANLNSNGTEGVISILKKVRDPVDMKDYVRISGQSYKRQLRELIAEIAGTESISMREKPAAKAGGGKASKTVIVSEGNPVKYIDDDLFGYMLAEHRKRVAPVRTNGMISIFPYQEDKDFGVAYDTDPKRKEHNIFETEISTNVFRGNIFVELDRIGVFSDWELNELKSEFADRKALEKEERERRVSVLLKAILDYHGGAHLSRFFTKVYPEAIVLVLLNRKIPVIGEALRVLPGYQEGKKMSIDEKALIERYETFENYIDNMQIGLFESSFANIGNIQDSFNNKKCSILPMKKLRENIFGS